MYGRGTFDMKGGFVASLAALKAVVDSGTQLNGDVVVAGVCDEEFASIGTERVMEKTRVDAAIIGEPSALQIERCHKGFAWIDVETKGLAAHGSMWQTGVDAIAKMGGVLTGLETVGTKLQKRKHPVLGPASVHAGFIKGGLELSTYPDKCLLSIERRTIPGEERKDVEQEMEALLRGIADKDPHFKASYEITFYRGPMDVPESADICQTIVSLQQGGDRTYSRLHRGLGVDGHADHVGEGDTRRRLRPVGRWRSRRRRVGRPRLHCRRGEGSGACHPPLLRREAVAMCSPRTCIT